MKESGGLTYNGGPLDQARTLDKFQDSSKENKSYNKSTELLSVHKT